MSPKQIMEGLAVVSDALLRSTTTLPEDRRAVLRAQATIRELFEWMRVVSIRGHTPPEFAASMEVARSVEIGRLSAELAEAMMQNKVLREELQFARWGEK